MLFIKSEKYIETAQKVQKLMNIGNIRFGIARDFILKELDIHNAMKSPPNNDKPDTSSIGRLKNV